jgi:hypothetical protein
MGGMNDKLHAISVIASRRLYETVISPGYYIALSVGLALAALLVTGFAASIDTSGFDYRLNPIYDLMGRTLEGGVGASFFDHLFSEGPLVLALYVGIAPVFLYLALSTIFRFTVERSVGAVELVVYGPADGTSYFLASYVKDVVLGAAATVVLLLFLLLAAAANNLYVGPMLLQSLLIIVPLASAGFAYAVLASVVTDNAAASIALFAAVGILFLLLLAGRFMIVEGYARNLANVLGGILQWVSPLFYWGLGLRTLGFGNVGMFVLCLVLLLALSAALLAASSRILNGRGVRA